MIGWEHIAWGIGLVTAWTGTLFGVLKAVLGRVVADFDRRCDRMEMTACEIKRIDGDLKRIVAEIPIHYQRREDAVREMAKIDERYHRLVETVIAGLRREIAETSSRCAEIERSRDSDRTTYQLRDDAIREYTAINAKLDKLYDLMARDHERRSQGT